MIKTLTFALIICLVFPNIFSQDNHSKFSLGLSFNPHLSDQMHNISSGYEDFKKYFDSYFKLGWTTGGFFRMHIAGKFSLESGINFSNKGSASYYQWQLVDSIRDLLIAENGKYPEDMYTKSNDYFIDIPFTINYTVYNGQNITYYTRLGLITNFYVAAEGFQELNYNDGSQSIRHMNFSYRHLKEDYIVRMFNLSGLLAIGIEYCINSKFGLFIEPNFDMNLFPLYDADDLLIDIEKPRFYNIGIRFGFLVL